MRLTRQTNYAIRILMYCAANDGRLSRIPEIASAYGVSELFLFKILQPLVENRLVETVRGRNGGVSSASRPPRSPCSTWCASPRKASPWPNASRTTPRNVRWSTVAD